MTTAPRPRRASRPKIVIDAAQLSHLEALADGAMQRMPEMADRLLDELARARVVESAKLPDNIVAIGRKVTWRDESTGKEQSGTLVWPEDADIAQPHVTGDNSTEPGERQNTAEDQQTADQSRVSASAEGGRRTENRQGEE